MSKKRDILRKLDALAQQEDAFLQTRLVAAVLRGRKMQVRIAGVRFELAIEPANFEGFGVFRPVSHQRARLERRASMGERRKYLELFPAVRMVLCERSGNGAIGVLASRGDSRIALDGPVPIVLVEEAELFDTVVARFDGNRFWYEELDARADPKAPRYLRECVREMRPVKDLGLSGLTAEQREAYAVNIEARRRAAEAARLREIEARRTSSEGRILEALEHGGARLRDFVELQDTYRVTYDLDGSRHVSVVSRNDLRVLNSGICLSGEDEKFDLASLIGVLREGRQQWE